MKTRIITVALMAFGVTLFAQKKEIKKAEKALEKESYSEAMTFLNQAEPMLADADEEYKARFYAAKGQAIFKDGSISLDKIQEAVSTSCRNRRCAFRRQMNEWSYGNIPNTTVRS